MAIKTFTFATFEPPLWDAQYKSTGDLGGDLVLDVSEDAPPHLNRTLLRTRITTVPSPNPKFGVYTATHDVVVRVSGTYPTAVSVNDPDSDQLEDQFYTRPRTFTVFELRDAPGQIYTAMPIPQIKQMIQRFQKSHGHNGSVARTRTVNLRELERALKADLGLVVVIHGYDLANVLLSTPVARLDVDADADETEANLEVQHAKTRAEKLRFLKLYVQAQDQMVSVRVGENSSVRFPSYPDDGPALKVLELIEPIVAKCSRTA